MRRFTSTTISPHDTSRHLYPFYSFSSADTAQLQQILYEAKRWWSGRTAFERVMSRYPYAGHLLVEGCWAGQDQDRQNPG
jgi:hypothetical protein